MDAVSAALAAADCPHVYPDANLVRGLDYYTRTVFEFRSRSVGSQDAIAGGGRYDGLVASMGGPQTPAVGWALGVERTLMAALEADPEGKALARHSEPSRAEVFVAAMGERAGAEGSRVMESLRRGGLRVAGGLFGSSLKAQLKEAGRQKAPFAVILGDDELASGQCTLKDMGASHQERVALASLAEGLRARLAARKETAA